MKASCPREGLLSACQLASVAIPTREVRPILKNLKAVAEADRFTLMATDLELGIRLDVRGLQVLEPGWITARQLEAARVAISRSVKKSGKIYIRLFPDKSITKKPAETRMGTGKGAVEGWVAVVKPGRVIFEVDGVDAKTAAEAFLRAHHKLPIRTHMISREPVL